MNDLFEVLMPSSSDAQLVAFGPAEPNTGWILEIPERLSRRVIYPNLKLEVTLNCVFSGQRLEIESMTVAGLGVYVATRDLTQLALPSVMSEIVTKAIPDSSRWSQLLPQDNSNRLTSPEYLAQLYWYQYVGWGAPRETVMKYMAWSKPNTNFHLKKFHSKFQLPGAHSMPKQKSDQPRLNSK